jgi:hypothetical protein
LGNGKLFSTERKGGLGEAFHKKKKKKNKKKNNNPVTVYIL